MDKFMSSIPSFYEGKRVLITGHTGFKGTWLIYLLQELGALVYGYSLLPEENSLYEISNPKVEGEYFADIRDVNSLREAINQFRPELIFHLAAHSSLEKCCEIAPDVFEINVMGTIKLLEIVRNSHYKIPIVVITSDKCYQQTGTGAPYQECDPLGAADPYSTSKACQELVVQCYQLSFPEMITATARASNTIGGGDAHTSRLIPYLLDCFSKGKIAQLRNPSYVRPWQYVLDVLWGYLTLGKFLSCGDLIQGENSFNFGPDEDSFQTVEQIALSLIKYFPGAQYQIIEKFTIQEAPVLQLDNLKSKRILGWEPLFSYQKTLEQTAKFVHQCKEFSENFVCKMQVKEYLNFVEEKGLWA